MTPRRAIWRAAFLTGLVSGTFSTLVITLGAPRIGRSRSLDWMEIGTVLLGSNSIVSDPGWRQITAGIVVHQSADLFWAVMFFGAGAAWTAHRAPAMLLILGVPWAIATAAVEYYLILPTLQPIVPMQVPYWTALAVHLTSAAAYPVFPSIHSLVAGARQRYSMTGRAVVFALVTVVGAFLSLEILAQADREPYLGLLGLVERREEFDRAFMRRMTAHHRMGLRLADLSVWRSERAALGELSRLMIANQQADIEILDDWWRRWFGGAIPAPSVHEHQQIPGMPTEEMLGQLSASSGLAFENRFLDIMSEHHRGAVMMADEAWREAGDVRLRLFAESLRHAQRGQLKRMAELQGAEP